MIVQQTSRVYIISPVVDHFSPELPFLSYPKPLLEEKAVEKLRIFKEEIEFDALLKGEKLPTQDEMRYSLAIKAQQLKIEADK